MLASIIKSILKCTFDYLLQKQNADILQDRKCLPAYWVNLLTGICIEDSDQDINRIRSLP